jgi:hypothetical protein
MYLTILGFKYFKIPLSIMAKQNFTPAGVQAKVAELYALPDANLQSEAASMRTDFRTWLSNNFTFDTSQAAYLAKMDIRFLQYAGQVTSTAASSKLGISLVASAPPDKWSSKYIITEHGPTPKYDSGGGYGVTGSVQFTIGYTQ